MLRKVLLSVPLFFTPPPPQKKFFKYFFLHPSKYITLRLPLLYFSRVFSSKSLCMLIIIIVTQYSGLFPLWTCSSSSSFWYSLVVCSGKALFFFYFFFSFFSFKFLVPHEGRAALCQSAAENWLASLLFLTSVFCGLFFSVLHVFRSCFFLFQVNALWFFLLNM